MEKDFNHFVSRLVHYHLSSSTKYSRESLAETIGLSQSFFDKCLHSNEGKHFNLRHLFLIAEALEISIDKLLPSRDGYKLLHNKELNHDEWKALIQNYKNINIEE